MKLETSFSFGFYLVLISFQRVVYNSVRLDFNALGIDVDLHFIFYKNRMENTILPVYITMNRNVPTIKYIRNTSFAHVTNSFDNLRLRNVCLSLWVIQEPTPAVGEINSIINNREGFKEQVVFLFILPKLEKVAIENSFKLNLYSAQMHFIFIMEDDRRTESYFVCRSCMTNSFKTVNELEPSWQTEQEESFLHLIHEQRSRRFPKVIAAVNTERSLLCDTINCPPKYRFLQCAKVYFNYTLLLPTQGSNIVDVDSSSQVHSIFIGTESYVEWYRKVGPNYAPYIRDTEDYYILYCENGWITAQTSYSHWTSPFDLKTWLMMLGVSVAVAVVGAKFNAKELPLRILDSLAIILREPMGNTNRFCLLHVLLALCFLCLSLKYESVLTSEMTVPPPPLVAKNLKSLIVEKGFKVFFPVFNRSLLPFYDLYEFRNGFKKYNIEEFYPNLQGQDYPGASKKHCLANRTNKLATDVSASEQDMQILQYGTVAYENERFCHIAIEPFFKRYYSFHIRGHAFLRIVNFLHLLREVGLEVMWNRNYGWLQKLKTMRIFMKQKNAAHVLAKYSKDDWEPHEAMKLSEKVVQIFIISGFVLGVALLCFIGEFVLRINNRVMAL